MESFAALVNGSYSLTIVAKLSILNVCVGPVYNSEHETVSQYHIFYVILDLPGNKSKCNSLIEKCIDICTGWKKGG